MTAFYEWITNVDFAVLRFFQDDLSCKALDALMPFISSLGNAGIIWILTGFTLLFFKKFRRWGIILLIGLAVGALIGNIIMKPLIARDRPCWIDKSVILLIKNPLDYSFPSGHTLSSFVAAFILIKADKRIGWVAFSLAVLIAFSRLYLYVHFPSDVFAGVVIGTLVGFGTFKVSERFLKRRKRIDEEAETET